MDPPFDSPRDSVIDPPASILDKNPFPSISPQMPPNFERDLPKHSSAMPTGVPPLSTSTESVGQGMFFDPNLTEVTGKETEQQHLAYSYGPYYYCLPQPGDNPSQSVEPQPQQQMQMMPLQMYDPQLGAYSVGYVPMQQDQMAYGAIKSEDGIPPSLEHPVKLQDPQTFAVATEEYPQYMVPTGEDYPAISFLPEEQIAFMLQQHTQPIPAFDSAFPVANEAAGLSFQNLLNKDQDKNDSFEYEEVFPEEEIKVPGTAANPAKKKPRKNVKKKVNQRATQQPVDEAETAAIGNDFTRVKGMRGVEWADGSCVRRYSLKYVSRRCQNAFCENPPDYVEKYGWRPGPDGKGTLCAMCNRKWRKGVLTNYLFRGTNKKPVPKTKAKVKKKKVPTTASKRKRIELSPVLPSQTLNTAPKEKEQPNNE